MMGLMTSFFKYIYFVFGYIAGANFDSRQLQIEASIMGNIGLLALQVH